MAIHNTGKKGLAWDCLTIWAVKLISTTTPSELLRIAEKAEVELYDLDLSWMEEEELRGLEKEDHEDSKKLKGTMDKYSTELNWIPKEVKKIVKNSLEPWETHRETCHSGNHVIRKLLMNALENEEAICGRLFLMQCERKKKRSKSGLPSKKTTRPITVSSVIQKILEKILLKRITDTVIKNTEVENAGFKPFMSCELQLQRMKMFLLNNLKMNRPTYIVSCDIKSAYD